MNVLLISQCSGRALPETRRILDQFAERRGERTWQTAITQQGLDAIRRLLRKSARRNSAIACHWIRGHNRSELLWIVGNASNFNSEGAVPTNTTVQDIRRTLHENDWRTGEVIRLLAKLAALFHDVGKASESFQEKLRSKEPVRDAFRHEWVSLRMFMAVVGSARDDTEWLVRLSEQQADKTSDWLTQTLYRDGVDEGHEHQRAFDDLCPPLGRAVGWLIVSHHFLPRRGPEEFPRTELLNHLPRLITAAWNRARPDASVTEREACWRFPLGSPFASASWCADVRRVAQAMRRHPNLLDRDWLKDPFVAHISRLCVMLADHHYSGQPTDPSRGDPSFPLYANTDKNAGGALKQRLDEHLMGVAYHAGYVARQLPRLDRDLSRIARHKGFVRRSEDSRFAWQDRAFDLACSLRHKSEDNGFFGVNMASTGCGKTLANGRIAYALANPQRGARFTIALGLRTLTLQTGEAYRQKLKLGPDDLAVRVGGPGVRELFEYGKQRAGGDTSTESPDARRGSESAEALLGEDAYVHYDGSLPDGPLKAWLKSSPGALALVNAPILVCTIDHLIPATEGTRGGQQIAPMLRLLTSDLVLDEPDDFDLEDLPALTRLVNWAAMLGSRVLLSSATLPPALMQGLFAAYLAGRSVYHQNRGLSVLSPSICCAWFDEHLVATGDCATAGRFSGLHEGFVDRRLQKLSESMPRRQAIIQPLNIAADQPRATTRTQWAQALEIPMQLLHERHHCVDPKTKHRVSFGLIRMAHIDPLIDTALCLFAAGAERGQRIHLCCYHSQHPLVIRAAIERTLDRCLDRRKSEAVFNDPEMRARLDRYEEPDQLFVVLATPVAEVGRDHDYDWAIVEPSSMRSIIQLAGRVMRHREAKCSSPNVMLLGTNLKSLESQGTVAYCKPGFERDPDFRLASHQLADILNVDQYAQIDAAPRIAQRALLRPKDNLVDLEHARLAVLMGTASARSQWPVSLWWENSGVHLTSVLQERQPFRQQQGRYDRYILAPNEDMTDFVFKRVERFGPPITVDSMLERIVFPTASRIESWGPDDFLALLVESADALEMSVEEAALRFGGLELRETEQGWRYNSILGFGRRLA